MDMREKSTKLNMGFVKQKSMNVRICVNSRRSSQHPCIQNTGLKLKVFELVFIMQYQSMC